MKKVILVLILLVSSSLFAGWYDKKSSNSKDREQSQRGYEKPGDDNYLNQQSDEMIHGKDNAYQGSRAGDDDYLDRVNKDLMNKR